MTILRLEYIKNGAAVQVSTDEGPFVLDATDVITLHLAKGMSGGEELSSLLYENAGRYHALQKAAGSLAHADFSKEGLLRRLKEKKVEEHFARMAVDHYSEIGFLNDALYAEKLARYYLEEKGWGRQRATVEMRQKGLCAEDIEEALDGIAYEPLDAIREIIARKYAAIDWQDRKQRKRACDGLYRYGFSFEDISVVVRECSDEALDGE